MKRLFGSAVCLSAWLIALFSGYSLAGTVHLLLVAALVLFPWRAISSRS